MLGETIYLLIIRRQVFYSVAYLHRTYDILSFRFQILFSDWKLHNFRTFTLELSPWNSLLLGEISCNNKFHAGSSGNYLPMYVLMLLYCIRTYPMYYLPGTSCESSWKFYESSSESFTRSLKSWSFQSLLPLGAEIVIRPIFRGTVNWNFLSCRSFIQLPTTGEHLEGSNALIHRNKSLDWRSFDW